MQVWLRGTVQKLPAGSTVNNWRKVEEDPLGSILLEAASVPLLAPLVAAQQPPAAASESPVQELSNGMRKARCLSHTGFHHLLSACA